jgi:glycerol-3-phosphate acyltransferase PlsY
VGPVRVALALIVGYFVGAVPFGVLIGQRTAGVDVRRLGSGNIGATNVLRVLGPQAAALVLAMDVAKGIAAVFVGKWLVGGDVVPLLTGLAAVVGHNWSIFLRFGGGKGVATTAGVVIASMPLVASIAISAFLITVTVTRYVSLGSLAMAALLPLLAWFLKSPPPHVMFVAVLALMTLWRHRPNIVRLIEGRENKLGKRVR